MGGSGKTTLTKKLYNHQIAKRHFKSQAWVSVSQEWNTQQILVDILKQVAGQKKNPDEIGSIEELVEDLRKYLRRTSFLIILDDVWKKESLRALLPAFPIDIKRSRIIVTTRNREVVQFADLSCFFHEPPRLNESKSWELFSKIALYRRQSGDIDGFKKLGEHMLKKCDGLPLAIVALGGILAAKENICEWERVSRAVSSRVMEAEGRYGYDYGTVKHMLALSYQELPYDLKPCFLYFALFPEDEDIFVPSLINMWVAEGFVTSQHLNGEETLEDVAEQFVDELVQRCVIQVETRDYDGRVLSVRIHDLMRDLCIEEAKKREFLKIITSVTTTQEVEGAITQSRRVSICTSTAPSTSINIPDETQNSHVQSIFVFNNHPANILGTEQVSLKTIHKNFQLLKVLTIHGASGVLPDEIENLTLLRCLEFRTSRDCELPKSMGNLRNLLTFDLTDDSVDGGILPPNVFWKMEKLRHLYLRLARGVPVKEFKLDTLKNLQTLWGVRGGNWMLREMSTLSPTVTKIRITHISSNEQLDAVFQCPSVNSGVLQTLHLRWNFDIHFELKKLELLHCCDHLYKLYLYGPMSESLSSPVQFPSNLMELDLVNTILELQETMSALGKLSNLMRLDLRCGSYMGSEWTCSAGEFPQLKALVLEELENLVEWEIETGAMPRLSNLSICRCKNMKRLPEGLRHITTLQELTIQYMPEEFYKRLRQADNNGEIADQGGEDLHIIQHIPIVILLPLSDRNRHEHPSPISKKGLMSEISISEDVELTQASKPAPSFGKWLQFMEGDGDIRISEFLKDRKENIHGKVVETAPYTSVFEPVHKFGKEREFTKAEGTSLEGDQLENVGEGGNVKSISEIEVESMHFVMESQSDHSNTKQQLQISTDQTSYFDTSLQSNMATAAALRGHSSETMHPETMTSSSENMLISSTNETVPGTVSIGEATNLQPKFSYDQLKASDMKSCFLYCALFPEDELINVSELVECLIDERLLAGTVTTAFERGYDIVRHLVDASLLETTDDNNIVKMRGVVRDMALSILSSEMDVSQLLVRSDFMLTQLPKLKRGIAPSRQKSALASESVEGFGASEILSDDVNEYLILAHVGLKMPPSEEEWKQARMIFLMDNDLSSLPERLNCPNLSVLFLQRNCNLRVIPPFFFDLMPSLQVLNLSKTRIRCLPQSLTKLESLQVLILRDSERLLELPPEIGNLKFLEVLDLRGTKLILLPDTVVGLVSLKHLQVSFYGSVIRSVNAKLPKNLISKGVISSLKLTELAIFVYPGDQRWASNAFDVTMDVSSLKLSTLAFHFPDLKHLEYFIHENPSWKLGSLSVYSFIVGPDVKRIVSQVSYDVELMCSQHDRCLRYVNGENIPDAIVQVLKQSTSLYLDHHLSICYLSDFGSTNTQALKFCIVRDCPKLKAIINDTELETSVFPYLEHLGIYHLWNLNRIWVGQLPTGSFSQLRYLSLHACPQLTFLFSCSMINVFFNLEELVVEDCPSLKDVVTEHEAFTGDNYSVSVKEDVDNPQMVTPGVIVLHKLQILKLHYLPELTGIWKGPWPSLKSISFYNCPNLKNLHMDSFVEDSIEEIMAEVAWWDALEWEDISLARRLRSIVTEISDGVL